MPGPDTTSTPSTLTPDATARALDDGAVVRWWQATALLEVAGPDAPTLLDGLCTQAVERIRPGSGVLGLFLDAKAKVIAPAVIHRHPDAAWTDPKRGAVHDDSPHLVLETLPELVEPLRAHLSRYRLRAKATIEPSTLATIAIVGAGADALVADLEATGQHGTWTTVADQARPTVAFIGSPDACRRLVRDTLPAAGAGLADVDALEADRITRAVAGLHDLLPGRMPAEVRGMETAVALDAGCYLGQEPVARLHYRGRANRTLRRLRSPNDVVPAGADHEDPLALVAADAEPDARPLGRLTTWARATDGTTVALAVLRREVELDGEVRLVGTDLSLQAADAPPEAG